MTTTATANLPQADLQYLLRVAGRNRRLMTGIFLTVLLVAVIAVFSLPNRYTATTVIAVDAPLSTFLSNSPQQFMPMEDKSLKTERKVIGSDNLLERTARQLDVLDDPSMQRRELSPAEEAWNNVLRTLRKSEWLAQRLPQPRRLVVEPVEGQQPTEEDALAQRIRLQERIHTLRKKMNIEAVENSRILEVSATTTDPQLSVQMTNTHAQTYLEYHVELHEKMSDNLSQYLNATVGELKDDVRNTEQQLHSFSTKSGLVEGKDSQLIVQQISEASSILTQTQAKIAETQARITNIQSGLNSSSLFTNSDILESPLISDLRRKQLGFEEELRSLRTTYGSRHPKIVSVQEQLEQTRIAIDSEARKIVASLRNELGSLQRRAVYLRSNLDDLKQGSNRIEKSRIVIDSLESDIDASRKLLGDFLTKAKEIDAKTYLDLPNVYVVSQAEEPTKPSGPRRGLLIGFAALIGIVLACMAALVREALDNVFRTQKQLEKAYGLTPLALVPRLQSPGKHKPETVMKDKPFSPFAEGLRNLALGLDMYAQKHAQKTLMVTSSVPKEGKSTLALVLGREISRRRRVLLIDIDVRCPTIHSKSGLTLQPGFSDLITKGVSLSSVLKKDPQSSLHIITAGSPVANLNEELGGEVFTKMLAELGKVYDLIIFDTPPVLATADTPTLAQIADRILYVVAWGKTRRKFVNTSFKKLGEFARGKVDMTFNLVDVKKNREYGEEDSVYYSSVYKKYYQSA